MALFSSEDRRAEARERLRRRLVQLGQIRLNPLERTLHFFSERIWEDRPDLPRLQRFFYAKLRILTLSVWNFQGHGAPTHAAALTYTSLVALVPFLAVVVSLFSLFGGLENVQKSVMDLIIRYLAPGMGPEVAGQLEDWLRNVRAGAGGNAAIGALVLCVTVIRTLATLEGTFNVIVGSRRGRSWPARVAVYWAVASLGPLLLGASLTMSAAVQSSRLVRHLSAAAPWIERLYVAGPPLLTCTAFTILYLFLPASRVKPKAALTGGIVGGLVFEVAKGSFALASVEMLKKYNQIYAGIATLFVFLFWLYISWTILLMGLELVVATQSATTHRKEELATSVSPRFREMIALRLMVEICADFHRGAPPPAVDGLGTALDLPARLLYDVLTALEEHGIVRAVEGPENDPTYVPGRTLERITAGDVIAAVREAGAAGLSLREGPETRYIRDVMTRTELALSEVYARETMSALVAELDAWKRARRQESGAAGGAEGAPEARVADDRASDAAPPEPGATGAPAREGS